MNKSLYENDRILYGHQFIAPPIIAPPIIAPPFIAQQFIAQQFIAPPIYRTTNLSHNNLANLANSKYSIII